MANLDQAASDRLRNKFRGCLVGAVLGDCFGANFEDTALRFISLEKVRKFTRERYQKQEVLLYTNDTAMTRSLADSLLSNGGFNGTDMAKRFAEEYFNDQSRFYGGHVPDVFYKLQMSNYTDPEGPANQQFDGSGSYGNGSAMRVTPVALFTHNRSIKEAQTLATKTSRITHTHPDGINGAIMQMLAVRESLMLNADQDLDVFAFLDKMLIYMEDIEHTLPTNITAAMEGMDEVEKNSAFGNGIVAIEAVPAAVMAFLCIARKPNNTFMDVIEYALSLAGDTDTVGSMAGAIAGCFYGYNLLPKGWIEKCEGTTYAFDQADKLFDYVMQHDK
ncbi:expressed hypothetical protein [Trichoplax adhaerens]|uniref:ADP-ribosylhydrolase ARH3 n=1 Tax=Trichoplax adhaerens TaxID=10228 RepID=B3RV11_TRIAD|nr:expressed hypothetical protein [Trichoplax adhaerens]EDV25415.1 expressed hypothetical protein [Trichoplax adhaerens]|eukprot:XP_002111448.1 expressed hypothetical protein [Trichoplax adhaerens]